MIALKPRWVSFLLAFSVQCFRAIRALVYFTSKWNKEQNTTEEHEFLRTFLYFQQNLFFHCRLLLSFFFISNSEFSFFLFLIFIYIYSFHYYDLAFFILHCMVSVVSIFSSFRSWWHMSNSITSIHGINAHMPAIWTKEQWSLREREPTPKEREREKARETHTVTQTNEK